MPIYYPGPPQPQPQRKLVQGAVVVVDAPPGPGLAHLMALVIATWPWGDPWPVWLLGRHPGVPTDGGPGTVGVATYIPTWRSRRR